MKLSTRSRYGLRMMYEIALHYGSEPVIIKNISINQEISEKYLSKLIIPLKGARLVNSSRGSHGGYMLSRDPSEITVREILEVLEGGISPVDCSMYSGICHRSSECPTRDVWCRLENSINSLLESITLADLVKNNGGAISTGDLKMNKNSSSAENRKSAGPVKSANKQSACTGKNTSLKKLPVKKKKK